jgi:hypothetical protein
MFIDNGVDIPMYNINWFIPKPRNMVKNRLIPSEYKTNFVAFKLLILSIDNMRYPGIKERNIMPIICLSIGKS